MKRLAYIAPLSAVVVLVFAAVALAQVAQDSPNQSSSDQYGADQARNPNPNEQTTPARPTEQATPAQNTPTVSIRDNAFAPAQLNITPGTTVTFVNEDTKPRTVVADGLFNSPELPPGYSYPVLLDGSGTVTYHDGANPEVRGTITIGQASQGGATTPGEPAGEPSQTGGRPTQKTDDATPPSRDSAQMGSSS